MVVVAVLLGATACQPSQWKANPQGAAASHVDGRLEFFSSAFAAAGAWHAWQVAPNGGWLSASLPTPPFSTMRIEAARNADGRLEVFAAGNGQVWHTWERAPGGWAAWQSLGGPGFAGELDVAANPDGRLEVFAIRTIAGMVATERVVHAWQTTPNGTWSGWSAIGVDRPPGSMPDIVVGQNADGRLEVFTSGAVPQHVWQTPSASGWSAFVPLPLGSSAQLAVAPNEDGRLEVFGNDGTRIANAWQITPNGAWAGGVLTALPFPTSPFAQPLLVGPNADGRLEVFFTIGGGGGAGQRVPGHIWQLNPNGTAGWSGAVALPAIPWGYTGLPAVAGLAANADGRLELSVVMLDSLGTSTFTVHAWQVAPNGVWSGWQQRVA
jgi:hypothetical protein